MGNRSPELKKWAPFLFGFIATLFVVAPGYVSPDPTVQYELALSGKFSDWHPPLMAFVWRMLDPLWPGAGSMLVFHLAMFWAGVGLWVQRWTQGKGENSSCTRWILAGIWGAYPATLAMVGIIWKDVGFGAAMLLGTALLLGQDGARSKWITWVGWLALFYAFSIRLNSLPALVPIFGLMVWQAQRRRARVLAGCIGLVVASIAVKQVLIEDRRDYPEQQILLYDLAAISLGAEQDLFPAYVRNLVPDWSLQWVRRTHMPLDAGGMANSGLLVKDAHAVEELKGAWVLAVKRFPSLYWHHREMLFFHLMSLRRGAEETFTMLHPGGPTFPETRTSRLQKNIEKYFLSPYLEAFRTRKVFSNGLYFLALPLLVWVAFLMARFGVVQLAVAASGYLYTLAYFFIGTAGNFRYSWWTVLAAMIVLGELWFYAKPKLVKR